jgi:hypothetical protein
LLQHPVVIACIASGKNAQIASVIQLHAASTAAAENGVVEDPRLSTPLPIVPLILPLTASIYSVD